jgi:hypothetical protein
LKRILLALAVGVGLFLVVRAAIRALASDETKIRWTVEDMAEGFDRTRMDPILVAFAPGFQDETSGSDRQNVREALAYLFLTAKDPETKAFPYRVEVDVRRIAVDRADPDSPTAECELGARFLDRRGGRETAAWEIAIESRWRRGEYGWRIESTRYESKSGRMIR